MSYDTVVSDAIIAKTSQALESNGFTTEVVMSGEDAKAAVLQKIAKGAEVLTVTSQTLENTGIAAAINDSGDYDAVKPKLMQLMGDESKKREQRKLGAAPDVVVGSVHAVTQDGQVLIASNTGSQLPAYAYGADTVIWVVGAQKIVADLAQAEDRLTTHVFPLENERSKQAYGAPSNISKQLIYSREVRPGRVHIIIVKQALGF